ncbi:hypothetical protein FJD38_24375 [Pseudomonas saxonica]|uniref:Immunity protein 63 domain-containing protein n=1 Tax=Pseudomonas saxonica TaxID=2600598 RepID=A0ABY3GAR8_9PSED|nr:hypothetical protein [Pseudomonas saxonica]TWR83085.1 hypothetical protein FJD38_24375 [Pseudomonas saxonica]
MENLKTTSLSKLADELKILGTPDNHYSIGINQNERTCILNDGKKWLVYYSERGQMTDLKEFKKFEDAKIEFLARLI